MRTALVFGGSGQIGTAVSRSLLEHGWHVFAATRSGRLPPGELLERGVSPIDAKDRRTPELLAEIGGTVDALVEPLAFDEKDARTLLDAAPKCGAIVVLSSASVYVDGENRTLDEAGQNGFPISAGHAAKKMQRSRRGRKITRRARSQWSARCSIRACR